MAVTGTGFSGASAVSFGSAPASAYTVNSSTQSAPPRRPGRRTVDITVTTPSGTSATSGADQFVYEAAPSVSALSPVAGPLSGGTTVVITGTGFSGASAVDFGVQPRHLHRQLAHPGNAPPPRPSPPPSSRSP